MRLLITGASGFIGQAVIAEARKQDMDFVACAREARELEGSTIHALDFAAITDQELFENVQRYRCTHLLHLAWGVQAGFWHSRDNLEWVSHTMRLTRAFLDAKGTTIVGTGSCAEYDPRQPGPWHEASLVRGTSLYATSKIATQQILERACADANVRFAWARIAYPYGPHEPQQKFIRAHIEHCRNNIPITLREPHKYVDYIHVSDVARALLTLIENPRAQGPYNIASGTSIQLATLVQMICTLLDAHPPITAMHIQSGDCLLRNNHLQQLGWHQHLSLDEGLQTMLSSPL